MTDKLAIRRAIAEKKALLTDAQIDDASARLAARLFDTPAWKGANTVYAYLSFNQEVRTRPVIEQAWSQGKRVAVPKVIGRDMRFIWLDNWEGLCRSDYGIDEPEGDGPIAEDRNALILVPGLAFDEKGHRIGYGGGYYDRYLEAHPGYFTAALCFDFQLVDHIDAQPHDIPVDLVLSEPI